MKIYKFDMIVISFATIAFAWLILYSSSNGRELDAKFAFFMYFYALLGYIGIKWAMLPKASGKKVLALALMFVLLIFNLFYILPPTEPERADYPYPEYEPEPSVMGNMADYPNFYQTWKTKNLNWNYGDGYTTAGNGFWGSANGTAYGNYEEVDLEFKISVDNQTMTEKMMAVSLEGDGYRLTFFIFGISMNDYNPRTGEESESMHWSYHVDINHKDYLHDTERIVGDTLDFTGENLTFKYEPGYIDIVGDNFDYNTSFTSLNYVDFENVGVYLGAYQPGDIYLNYLNIEKHWIDPFPIYGYVYYQDEAINNDIIDIINVRNEENAYLYSEFDGFYIIELLNLNYRYGDTIIINAMWGDTTFVKSVTIQRNDTEYLGIRLDINLERAW